MIITSNKDDTVWKKSDETGDIEVMGYQIFSGIQLFFMDAHMQSYTCVHEEVAKEDSECPLYEKCSENMFEIIHCTEGRIECSDNDSYCYVSEGDLAVCKVKNISKMRYFSISHFHGISIRIDLDCAFQNLSKFLNGIDDPYALFEKFCSQKPGYVIRSNSSIEHIFAELYSVSKKIEKEYLKLKVLELLLFLSAFEVEEVKETAHTYSKTQVVLLKEIMQYVMQHMDSRITLEQLSKHFRVSGSYIKNMFKGIYGVSYYQYVCTQKMQSAAYMLKHTDKSILEIAGEHGYENGSKFSSAFKRIIGMSPHTYRKQNALCVENEK